MVALVSSVTTRKVVLEARDMDPDPSIEHGNARRVVVKRRSGSATAGWQLAA